MTRARLSFFLAFSLAAAGYAPCQSPSPQVPARTPPAAPAALAVPAASASPAAASIDRDWLKAHRSDPGFGPSLLQAVRAEADTAAAGLLLMDFYPSLATPEDRVSAALYLARLAELEGRWDLAAVWFGNALKEGERPELRLSLALCQAEAGAYEAALSSLASLAPSSPEARGRGAVLRAWCLAASDRRGEALAASAAVARDPAAAAWKPQALFLSALLGAPGAKARLLAECPGSPEAESIATWGGTGAVSVRPAPLLFLSGIAESTFSGEDRGGAPQPSPIRSPEPPSPRPAAAAQASPGTKAAPTQSPRPQASPAPEADRPRAYQIGVFSRRENAALLQEELLSKGFEAKAEEGKARDGSPRWSVLVPVGSDPSTLFARLQDSGYEVYPVY